MLISILFQKQKELQKSIMNCRVNLKNGSNILDRYIFTAFD